MAINNNVKSVGNTKVTTESPSPSKRIIARPTPERSNSFRSLVTQNITRSSITSHKRNLSGFPTVSSNKTMSNVPPKQKQRGMAVLTALSEAFDQTNNLIGTQGDCTEQYGQTISAAISNDQEIWEELYKRPEIGETYKAVTVDVERIKQSLKDLSINGKGTIDEGLEIADAASLLKLKRNTTPEIEKAGQKAQRAAVLLLQAHIMSNKGKELLAESKRILLSADL